MNQDLPYIFGFGLALAGAAASSAYLLSGGSQFGLATAAAVSLVGLSQLSLLAMSFRNSSGQGESFNRVVRDVAVMKAEVLRSVDMAKQQFSQFNNENAQRVMALDSKVLGMTAALQNLRKPLLEQAQFASAEIKNLQLAQEEFSKRQVLPQRLEINAPQGELPVLRTQATPARAQPAMSVDDEQIRFSLEPIIHLQQQTTAHYRLHVAMQVPGGELSGAELLRNASQVGKRPKLDALSVHQALGLLTKLRVRDPNLCIFVQVGPDTLGDPAVVGQMLKDCVAAGEAVPGLILELQHASLSSLPSASLEGLATFARAGIGFALANATISSLDLTAMQMLNIRFVGLGAQSLAIAQPGRLLSDFVHNAGLLGIEMVVTDVTDAGGVASLLQITSLACGPCFAAPRRVKRMTLNGLDSLGQNRLAA